MRLLSVAANAVIVVACVVVDVALHRLGAWAFDFNYFDNGLPQSVLVEKGYFPAAASLGFVVMFAFLGLSYARSRSKLRGTPFSSGLRFFAPIAFIMFFGVFESAFIFPTPFKAELVTAFADAAPYILLGALLSRFARPEGSTGNGREGETASWRSMVWVALFFVLGRYLVSYPILQIVSGYKLRVAGTLAWTVGCGLSMGAFYWLAGSSFAAGTPIRKALRVGAFTLGVFWLMIQLFFALISDVSISDLLTRAAADAAYLVIGIYSYERMFRAGRSLGRAVPA